MAFYAPNTIGHHRGSGYPEQQCERHTLIIPSCYELRLYFPLEPMLDRCRIDIEESLFAKVGEIPFDLVAAHTAFPYQTSVLVALRLDFEDDRIAFC